MRLSRFTLGLFGVLGLAGCGDVGPSAPAAPPRAAAPAVLGSLDLPLQDALDRIVPALGSSPAADGLRSALTDALDHANTNSHAAVEAALQRLTVEQPDAAADAEAIRLAITAP